MRRPGPNTPGPFLKWAGGKTQLLGRFAALYPPRRRGQRFVEPFVGGGSVFFHVHRLLQPAAAILSDANQELISAYTAVRDDVESVVEALERHRKQHSEEHFYRVRSQPPEQTGSAVESAARLIYLNKTCFNGLYRVNSRGLFNVPMGKYVNPAILNADGLRRASGALANATLQRADFRLVLKQARKGDFVYFDPPYDPVSNTAKFTAYTGQKFGQQDQEALAEIYAALAKRGCL